MFLELFKLLSKKIDYRDIISVDNVISKTVRDYKNEKWLNVLDDEGEVVKVLNNNSFKEKGKQLAKRLADKVPLIYASDRFKAVAYRWKTQINENAKVHAFTHTFSELNHNELVGYTSLKGYYYVVIIKDEADLPQMRKRMMLTKEIIRKSGVDVIEIGITGGSLLTKMFSAIYIGDWTSYYLALEYETDPTPVDLVENFKKKL